jgi:hypothetical protein
MGNIQELRQFYRKVTAFWKITRHNRLGKWEVRRSDFPYLFFNSFKDAIFEVLKVVIKIQGL